jgi:hypothetical protein
METNVINPEVEETQKIENLILDNEKRKFSNPEISQNYQEYFMNITEESVALWEVRRKF